MTLDMIVFFFFHSNISTPFAIQTEYCLRNAEIKLVRYTGHMILVNRFVKQT